MKKIHILAYSCTQITTKINVHWHWIIVCYVHNTTTFSAIAADTGVMRDKCNACTHELTYVSLL